TLAVLRFQTIHSAGNKRGGPAPFVLLLFTERRGRLPVKTALDCVELVIEKHKLVFAAAFYCIFAIPDIRHVIFKGSEQKRAKLSFVRIDLGVSLAFQEIAKETL